MLPKYLPHVFLANSGAEAMDGALKFARLFTKRAAFVATTKRFHGRTMGAFSVTWEPKYREGFGPLFETTHVQFNDAAALDKAVTDQTAAVVLEVVQGESGVNLGTPDFMKTAQTRLPRARRPADRRRNPDRFGRTGSGSRSSTPASSPTSCAWPRALAAGSRWARSPTRKRFGTFSRPARTAARSAARRSRARRGWRRSRPIATKDLIKRSATLGADMRNQLRGALEGVAMVRDIRGLGLMIAVELRTKVAPVLKSLMLNHGVIALPAGPPCSACCRRS